MSRNGKQHIGYQNAPSQRIVVDASGSWADRLPPRPPFDGRRSQDYGAYLLGKPTATQERNLPPDCPAEMERLGITPEHVAEGTGLTVHDVSATLHGRTQPDAQFVRAVWRLVEYRRIESGSWVAVVSDFHVPHIQHLMQRSWRVPAPGKLGIMGNRKWRKLLRQHRNRRSQVITAECRRELGYGDIEELWSRIAAGESPHEVLAVRPKSH